MLFRNSLKRVVEYQGNYDGYCGVGRFITYYDDGIDEIVEIHDGENVTTIPVAVIESKFFDTSKRPKGHKVSMDSIFREEAFENHLGKTFFSEVDKNFKVTVNEDSIEIKNGGVVSIIDKSMIRNETKYDGPGRRNFSSR